MWDCDVWVEKGLLKKIVSWLLKYLGNEVQGREDKYFINMCRWIYGLACHSSPVVFSSAHDRSVSCPLKTTPSLFLNFVKPLILELCSFWNPSWVILLPQKLTQPGRKSKYFVNSIGIHRWWLEKWGVVPLKYQNFKERRLQHPGSCFVSPQPCPSLGRMRAGAVLAGDRLQGSSLDRLLSLIFPFPIKKRTYVKKSSVTIPIFALHKPPTADVQQLHHSLF